MRPLTTAARLLPLLLLLAGLLLPGLAEPRRAEARKGRVRGRGRAGVMRRQTQECKEYVEAGEKYLDCQDRQLTTVMQDWPKDIHHLLLARNKIQVRTSVSWEPHVRIMKAEASENRRDGRCWANLLIP